MFLRNLLLVIFLLPESMILGRDIEEDAINLIKEFEGLYLDAYQDIGGIWTICYGDIYNVRPGMHLTEKECTQRLVKELKQTVESMEPAIPGLNRLNNNQFAALLSFTYNLGITKLLSTDIPKAVASNQLYLIPRIMLNYNKVKGKVIKGLQTRRKREVEVFNK